ncbi:hypothetical protein ACSFC0_24085 [Serratia marcescens]|uniref:hypothetical protein n=1 Tax=Serratia marcescens TaxID=615 RepID=UPI003EDAADE7
MKNEELKHVVALLLEDAKRRQELEPNAGTETRIQAAQKILGADKMKIIQDTRELGESAKYTYSSSSNNPGIM